MSRLLWPWCFLAGHDFFNGGEICRDCGVARPEGWAPASGASGEGKP